MTPQSTLAIGRADLIRAVLWMWLGIAAFLGLMIGIRQLATSMSIFEMLTLRSVVALVILFLFTRFFQHPILKTGKIKLHLTRNIFHFIGQYCWALGVILLPLAEVIAIEFTTPIWVVTLAVIFLGEKLTLPRAVSLIAGFIGVCIIVRPGFQEVQWGTGFVFIATIGFAITTLVSKKLTESESVWTILFYMALIQLIIGIIPTLMNWTQPTGLDYFWIFVIGVCGMVAHLGLTKALSYADTATVLPLDFIRLPATLLIGSIFYAEGVDTLVIVGATIIFCANYFHIKQESLRE